MVGSSYMKKFFYILLILLLDGVTIWQTSFGNSKIFDFNGTWQLRQVVGTINTFFSN